MSIGVRAKGPRAFSRKINITTLNKVDLLEAAKSDSKWLRRAALVELRDRQKLTVIKGSKRGQPSSATELEILLGSGNLIPIKGISDVGLRGYAVRRIADGTMSEKYRNVLIELAMTEESPEVVSQLIAVSKRMDANDGLKIVKAVLARDLFENDPHIPLLIWWSIESKAMSNIESIKKLYSESDFWTSKIVRKTIMGRTMRRYASEETIEGYLMCSYLLSKAIDVNAKKILIDGFSDASRGKQIGEIPKQLLSEFNSAKDLLPLPLRIRINSPGAVDEAIEYINNEKSPKASLVEVISTLGFVSNKDSVNSLKALLEKGSDKEIEVACLAALADHCDDNEVKEIAFEKVLSREAMVREAALDLLASERSGALFLVERCEKGEFQLQSANASIHEKLKAHDLPSIKKYLSAILTTDRAKITETQELEILRIKGIVRRGGGNPKNGEKTFTKLCVGCHKMYDSGGEVGPDLTSYQRHDEDALLMSLVAPGAEIREGYENVIIKTISDSVHSGFLVEDTTKYVVIRELSGASRVFEKNEISSLTSTGVSLMPQGLLNGISNDELKDFFAYLRSTTPPF